MRLPAQRVLQTIQQGVISPGYILMGTELYWRDRICSALRKAAGLESASFGLAEFDLRQDSLDRILEYAESPSMFAPRQLLFVKNAQNLLARRAREADAADRETPPDEAKSSTKQSKARSDSLSAYFLNPNPCSTLVFEMTDLSLESDDWRDREKAKSRVEAFESVCDVVLMLSPSFEEAAELVRRAAAAHGQTITPEAAEQLVHALHRNMAAIQLELEKLCLYDPEKGTIEAADVHRMLTTATGEVTVGLAEAIGARDATAALRILDALRRTGRYAPLIVSELARYLRQLILLKEAKARDPWQAARMLWDAKLGVPQGAVPALLRQARNFSGAELLHGLELAYEADLALRCSPPDEALVLESFILRLIKPSARLSAG
ncbi:MAG: DNA polymerase III subunit delta [Acidobacteria bacterium]|nr:DNA polymerase III subunit delta [Acidobacteriota bacterium]